MIHMKPLRTFLTILFAYCSLLAAAGCSKDEPTGSTALSAPSGSQIVAANDTSLTVAWTAPADSAQVTGFRVVRVGAGDSVTTDLPATARSIRFTGLIRGLGYLISIYAMHGSDLSAPLLVSWNSRMLPKAPMEINAIADGTTEAIVSWESEDTTVTGFRLAWDGVTFKDSGSMQLPADARMARITNLRYGQLYNIWLQSLRGGMVSSVNLFCLAFNDNPPPAPPLNLMANPQSGSAVLLKWTAAADTGTIIYRVLYGVKDQSIRDSVETPMTSAVISGLTPGAVYSFSVIATRMGKNSTAVSVESAPATRYTTEPGSASPIRIYEKGSTHGAGLTLDPAKGGPKNIAMTTADPSAVQLTILPEDQQSAFLIGPAYGFPEYKDFEQFDHDVYISDSTYVTTSLDDWYYTGSIDGKITQPDANQLAYRLPQFASDLVNGQGFFVRTGTTGNYHYARVFVKNNGGRLLQGTAPDRYVELGISYQSTPNLPFAKRSGRAASPAGVPAQRMR
jgi:hypothetical protein